MRLGVIVLIAAAAVLAQDAARGVEETRRAWSRSQELNPLLPPISGGASPAEKVRARAAFLDLFEKADWNGFDTPADRDLLRDGLWRTARRALDRGDGLVARKALEGYADRFPDDSSDVSRRLLPKALLLLGKSREALSRLEAPAPADAGSAERARTQVALGDARLLAGDREGALAAWKLAAAAPYDAGPEGPVDDARREGRVRAGFLGRPAPPLDAVDAIGGAAPAWADLRGKVVVVQPFSSGCNSCRAIMPRLEALRAAHSPEVLVVLGLTVVESEGFVPEQDTPEPSWVGERVSGIATRDFHAHLETVRQRMRIGYPWLVQDLGKALPWNLLDPHPIVVVGRDGTIAFAQVGGEDLSSVHAVVARLLSTE
jgi:thiol-disulfide isomerase/thioredoxin